jgi:hypothetical protein
MSAIDVHVSHGGRIVGGEVIADAATVATCSLCAREVESAAAIGAAFACAPCLRERLDALSVARFRLPIEAKSTGTPWGKVTG